MKNRSSKKRSRPEIDAKSNLRDISAKVPQEEHRLPSLSGAKRDGATPALAEGSSVAEVIPLADSDDPTAHIEDATAYRDILVRHLQDSLRPGATALTLLEFAPPNDTAAARDERARQVAWLALNFIPTADLVLWRFDLVDYAERNADAFAHVSVTDADIPRRNEFWCLYGSEIAGRMYSGTHALFQRLLISGASDGSGEYVGILGFHYPVEGGVLRLDKPPLLLGAPTLKVGAPPGDVEAQRYLACLSFRAQKIIQDEPADVHFTRAEQRRLRRAGGPPPNVRIVNLRRKERTSQETSDSQHLTDHQYQCQFLVSAHVRRPNPRMREQRPIWVNAYVKGPEGKPLKPPSRTIIVVNR